MNALSLTGRLFSAATAATITVALLSATYAIAEPQRSTLIAKIEHSQQAPAPIALALAVTGSAKVRK
ncbi:MAG: hypothetical protein ABI699_08720 [Caldimonas sp.]